MSALTDWFSWSDVDRSCCGKFKLVSRTSHLKGKERFWERGWFLTNHNQVTSPFESMQILWCFSKDAYIGCIYSWTQERFSFCYQGSYSCSGCRDGYVGDPYKECVPIKYCSKDRNSNPCGEGAECIPKKGGVHYECRVSVCLCLKSAFQVDFFFFFVKNRELFSCSFTYKSPKFVVVLGQNHATFASNQRKRLWPVWTRFPRLTRAACIC